jgi:hypothetical protein
VCTWLPASAVYPRSANKWGVANKESKVFSTGVGTRKGPQWEGGAGVWRRLDPRVLRSLPKAGRRSVCAGKTSFWPNETFWEASDESRTPAAVRGRQYVRERGWKCEIQSIELR